MTHFADHMAESVDLLKRVLSFFSRVDTKSSIVLGADIGMLGYLASKAPTRANCDYWMLFALVPACLISASLFYLYRCSIPELGGGEGSLQYFREIASRTEVRFIEEFVSQSPEDAVKDVLGQVWRNSQIVSSKLCCLHRAYALCAWSVVPWATAVAIFVTR